MKKTQGDVFDRIGKKAIVDEDRDDEKSEDKEHLKMGLNELIQRDQETKRRELNDKFYAGKQ